MNKALQQLRTARNAYLRDYNDEVLKYAALGEPLPAPIATYLQELRDLPGNITIIEDENGNLDESQFEWPLNPMYSEHGGK